MRKFISGLILGAGASQRFGPPKQLLPFRGTTMLGWVVDQAQQAIGLDEVVVVLGRAADECANESILARRKWSRIRFLAKAVHLRIARESARSIQMQQRS